jgi:hypothetical protein
LRLARLRPPQTISDAERAVHSSIVVAAHLGTSLIHSANIVSRAGVGLDLLKRVAALRDREVILCLPALLDVIDLEPVELHPMNLVASILIDLPSEEGHRHAALAADQTQLGFPLGGQSFFHSVYLFEGAIKSRRV